VIGVLLSPPVVTSLIVYVPATSGVKDAVTYAVARPAAPAVTVAVLSVAFTFVVLAVFA